MKMTKTILMAAAIVALSGCAVVPVASPYYAAQPAYYAPAPVSLWPQVFIGGSVGGGDHRGDGGRGHWRRR